MLQNKTLFRLIAAVIIVTILGSVVLIATKKSTIAYNDTIPLSSNLGSVPPQANVASDFSSVISNLPLDVSYPETRNVQETIGYLADPNKKGVIHTATYREGSIKTEDDGRISFLVDVADVQKTFTVYDNKTVDCASQAQQLEPSWRCTMPAGEVF